MVPNVIYPSSNHGRPYPKLLSQPLEEFQVKAFEEPPEVQILSQSTTLSYFSMPLGNSLLNALIEYKNSAAHDWIQELKVTTSLSKASTTVLERRSGHSSYSLSKPANLSVRNVHRKIIAFQAANQIDSETALGTRNWLEQLHAIAIENRLWWHEPLVNISIDAEVVFEWWHEHKKLTVYILGDTAEYIKVWGPDIDNEMQEGLAKSSAEITSLWKWIAT